MAYNCIVRWFGGKARLAKKIIPIIPVSRCYVEPFGGAASILCSMERREVEVYNDLDDRLVNLFRVLQVPRQAAALKRRLQATPYARSEFARALQEIKSSSPVGKAWAMFVLYNLGFSGKADTMGDWRIAKSNNVARTFANRVDRLDWYVERFRHVTIDNRPALKVLDVYDSQDTVFYCDPPYIPETRKSGGYRCEMDTADHEDLIKKLLTVKGRVVLSGYDSPRYRPLVNAGWKTRRFATRCIAMNNKVTADRNRKECLWISPD